jgi:threonylcarbamoyladenosine tRNA methylthiotransferase CDKAL1
MLRSLKPPLIESIPVLYSAGGSRPKVWVEAYGCSASIADSEMIRGLLGQAGYDMASSQDEGALSVVVTCSVKDATEHKMVSRIRSLAKSGKPLIVAGCLPKADQARVESISPAASLLGPTSLERIGDVARGAISGSRQVVLEDHGVDKVNIPRVRLNPAVSVVEIASGCLSECTFCQTKLAKGKLRSYRTGDIVRQVRSDVESGCREVWLTSTDNGCYGLDIGSDLVELLSACSSVQGNFKIRLGMMNPMYLPRMLDRLVDEFQQNDKLFKFIHLPVESGSDRILRIMKRGHTSNMFLESVNKFRQKIPNMTIATDIIVGFPTESEKDFEKTMDLIRGSRPDVVNLSRYSARPGTESARWKKGRVSSQVAKRRSERLHQLAREMSGRQNSLWMDWEGEVIIDEIGAGGTAQGRNPAYKSVMLPGIRGLGLGDRIRVKVYDFSSFSLRARIIPQGS